MTQTSKIVKTVIFLNNCCISLNSDGMSGVWLGGGSLCYREDASHFTRKIRHILQGRKNISFEPFCSTYSLKLILVSSQLQNKGNTCLLILLTGLLVKQSWFSHCTPLQMHRNVWWSWSLTWLVYCCCFSGSKEPRKILGRQIGSRRHPRPTNSTAMKTGDLGW